MTMMRRVVVTGVGLVTPLGVGTTLPWNRLCAGESGVEKITAFDTSSFPSKIAGIVPRGTENGEFSRENHIPPSLSRVSAPFSDYAFSAAHIALQNASLSPPSSSPPSMPSSSPLPYDPKRVGCVVGCGVGDLEGIGGTDSKLKEKGHRGVSPYFVPSILLNMAPSLIGLAFDLQGPTGAPCMACASGNQAILEAFSHIIDNRADVMIAGGTEAAVLPLAISGFSRMKALSSNFNDDPTKASRPFDKDRDGFVMGEGAGMLVLEEYSHALSRFGSEEELHKHIYCEIGGFGVATDAFHIAQPHPEGRGARQAMENALKMTGKRKLQSSARDNPHDEGQDEKEKREGAKGVGYVNAHATSTPLGDDIESTVVEEVFRKYTDIENNDEISPILLGSTKGSIGHLQGGAGGVEAAFCCLAIKNREVPPSLNLSSPSRELPSSLLEYVPFDENRRKRSLESVMSNSFGFGGINTSVLFQSCKK